MIKKASRLNTLNRNKYRNADAGNVTIPDVPDRPTNVVAVDVGTNRPFNNGAATVSFTPAATGGAATTFTVTSNPGSYTGTGSSSPVTVTGLQSGTAYTYTVVASNSTGSSTSSIASQATTATTVPSTPTIGVASFNSGQPYASTATVLVSYTVSSSSGGKTITSYKATSSSSAAGSGTANPLSVSDVTGSSQTYTVTATNVNGSSVASSASNAIIPATVPQAPTIGTVTSPDATHISVPYTPGNTGGNSITGYAITPTPAISLTLTSAATANPLTYSASFAANQGYTFTLAAVNAQGTSIASTGSNSVTPYVVVTPPPPPPAPPVPAGDVSESPPDPPLVVPVPPVAPPGPP